jgi:hypothetical protein
MRRVVVGMMLCVVCLAVAPARAEEHTLDEFLSNPARVRDVKTFGLLILSQGDPAVAEHNASELRGSLWAMRPEAGLSKADIEVALMRFDRDWKDIVNVVRERKMTSIAFLGIDPVLLYKAEDWYFGAATARRPVVIRLSVQFNPDSPMSVYGVKVWTKWDEVKAITRAIQIPVGEKVLSVSYHAKGESSTTQPAAGI